MKIANVIAASVVFALASVLASVGCSSPTSAPLGDGNSGVTTKGGGDDDDNASSTAPKAAASTSSSSGGATTPTTTTTDAGASGSDAACDACIASASPKLAAEGKCEDACADGDDNCLNNCWTTNCGTAQTNECTQAEDKCATACAPTPQEIAACESCVTTANATAGAYEKCFDAATAKCQPSDDNCFQTADDSCWSSSGCQNSEDACDNALSSCDSTCGG